MTANQQVATRETPKVIAALDKHVEQFAAALPATIPSERFVRIVKTALQRNPDLMKATPKSILLACEKAAADGLVLDGRDAALVVFKDEASYIPMIGGLIKRAYNTGLVASISVHLVYKNETTELDPATGRPRFLFVAGDDERIEHAPIVFGDKGPIVGAYAILRFKSGGIVRDLMTREEIERIAKLQKKNVENGQLKGVWREHFGEMCKKTVLRRLFKRQPMDSDLNRLFAEGDDPIDDDFDQRTDEERLQEDGKARAGRGPKQTARAASKLNEPEPETIDDAEYVEHDPDTGEIYDGPEGPDDYDQSPEPEQEREPAPQRRAPQTAQGRPTQAARPQSTRQQAKPAQRPAERDDDGFPAADGGDVF